MNTHRRRAKGRTEIAGLEAQRVALRGSGVELPAPSGSFAWAEPELRAPAVKAPTKSSLVDAQGRPMGDASPSLALELQPSRALLQAVQVGLHWATVELYKRQRLARQTNGG